MTNPTNWQEAIDEILEEYGYAIVNHPEASRASHIKTYKSALNNAVKEHVIGRDTATYHNHPFLSDYAMSQIHIAVNDMMLYDKTQHFTKETREWFEKKINEVVSNQLQVKCDNSLREKQRKILDEPKEK